jgi:hypothetical protein
LLVSAGQTERGRRELAAVRDVARAGGFERTAVEAEAALAGKSALR